ncbi:MAG TPA: MFS transporter [Verrucomicrobiota bacterium]|nr:MFS transporter [Verrucomicrobiota bacterium]HRZ57051.1 MFS transporter [Candidatus Paceibacterota bacterium]
MNRPRNYRLLLASQFIGAFGDNAILAVILGQLTFQEQAGTITENQLGAANALYTSLLFIPYVLLAPLAGFVNDRHAKTRWLLGGNGLKVAGTLVAMLSVWHGAFWQGLGYLIVGIGACFYSPAKYGILPEIVPHGRLVKANGTIEFLTLVAILTGYIGGATMIDVLPVASCYLILLALFSVALALNACMAATPSHPEPRIGRSLDEFFSNFGRLLQNRRLVRVLCGTGLFWTCGAVIKMNFQPWGLDVLELETNRQIALLGLWLSLGIMGGAMLAGQLHRVGDLRHTRRYGWILAATIALLGCVEFFRDTGLIRGRLSVIGILLAVGGIAGLFLIPLNAALQSESDQGKLGKTIATQNFIDNLGMLGAGAIVFMGNQAGLTASGLFLLLSALVALAVIALKVPPRRPAHETPVRSTPTLAANNNGVRADSVRGAS